MEASDRGADAATGPAASGPWREYKRGMGETGDVGDLGDMADLGEECEELADVGV